MRLCAFWDLFHVDCPGCGFSRAFLALLQGNVAQSIYHHPLAVVVACFLIWLFTRKMIELCSGKALPALLGRQAKDFVRFIIICALIGQWIARLILT